MSTSTDISEDLNDLNKNDAHISLWSSFDTEVANINEHVSSSCAITIEIYNYLKSQYVNRKEDPLL